MKIERVTMSGRGVKFTYSILDDKGERMFKTSYNSYHAWTRKKDAQRIIDAIDTHGLSYVEERLGVKAYLGAK